MRRKSDFSPRKRKLISSFYSFLWLNKASFQKTFSCISYSFLFYSRSKYFRGRRIHGGEYDVRVEQAEFKELSVTANSEGGVTASIILYKTGNKVVR